MLATAGVPVSAVVTGAAAVALLDLDWKSGLVLGAIIGSTDAAAVFALLNRPGVVLSERVGATLEIESGMNDPMAVYLTLTVIGLIVTAGPGTLSGWNVAMTLLRQFGRGALLGVRCGMLMAALVLRLPLKKRAVAFSPSCSVLQARRLRRDRPARRIRLPGTVSVSAPRGLVHPLVGLRARQWSGIGLRSARRPSSCAPWKGRRSPASG